MHMKKKPSVAIKNHSAYTQPPTWTKYPKTF